MTRANRLVRVREDNVLELIDIDDRPYLQVRPGYEELLGPCIRLYRVGNHEAPSHLCTIRLPVITELVRQLPTVFAAARHLRVAAAHSPLARTPAGRRQAG